jgi:hypothetical protein
VEARLLAALLLGLPYLCFTAYSILSWFSQQMENSKVLDQPVHNVNVAATDQHQLADPSLLTFFGIVHIL